jgi:hypothetical protein
VEAVMQKTPTDELVERVARLEEGHRRFKRLAVATLAASGVLFVAGAKLLDGSKTIEAERIVLKAKGGEVRATFEVAENGQPMIRMIDWRNKVRLLMGLGSGGLPELIFKDSDEKMRVGVFVLPGDSPSLQVVHKDAKSGVSVGLNGKDRGGFISVSDAERGLDVSMRTNDIGSFLNLTRKGGAIDLWLDHNGKPRIELWNEKDTSVFRVPK